MDADKLGAWKRLEVTQWFLQQLKELNKEIVLHLPFDEKSASRTQFLVAKQIGKLEIMEDIDDLLKVNNYERGEE